MRAQLRRVGDGLAVTIDRDTADTAELREGDSVEVAVSDGTVLIRRSQPSYTLAELLRDTTPESYRAAAVDWGPDVGREADE